jgi:hypothetical protein
MRLKQRRIHDSFAGGGIHRGRHGRGGVSESWCVEPVKIPVETRLYGYEGRDAFGNSLTDSGIS